MKNSKSVTLTSRSVRRWGGWAVGMEQHKISDQGGGDGVALNFGPVPNIRQSINKIQLKLQKI